MGGDGGVSNNTHYVICIVFALYLHCICIIFALYLHYIRTTHNFSTYNRYRYNIRHADAVSFLFGDNENHLTSVPAPRHNTSGKTTYKLFSN